MFPVFSVRVFIKRAEREKLQKEGAPPPPPSQLPKLSPDNRQRGQFTNKVSDLASQLNKMGIESMIYKMSVNTFNPTLRLREKGEFMTLYFVHMGHISKISYYQITFTPH